MKKIRIVVRGRELATSIQSELVDGHVLVPLKETAHALGVIGAWDGTTLKLQGKQEIIICSNQAIARVDNRQQALPVATRIREGQLLAPALALGPWFGVKVLWDHSAGALIFLQAEKALIGKKIIIDPGHGGKDEGAVGASILGKDLTLALAKRLGQLLEAAGAQVVFTRSRDLYVSLKRRALLANQAQGDLFLSLESNHFYDSAIWGTETYYCNSWQGQRLASALQRELAAEVEETDRGAREASFNLLCTVRAPAAIVKVLYLSNPQQEAQAKEGWFRQRCALALYRGIKDFLE